VRRRGGATVARANFDEPSYLEKSVVAAAQKMEIATLAATLVEDGDIIMLCAGTTTQALARMLARKRIMVVTNSLLVANELFDVASIEVYVVGGILRGNIRALIGGDAENAVARLKFNKVFLSGNGLTTSNGLSTPNMHVASFDRAAVESAAEVVVLADHTKLGIDSLARTVPADRIDVLVTDRLADPNEIELMRAAGIDVRVANPRS
jgi:DeoR/GlpR family transcriptional regulator of sugar metabolism